MHIFQAVILDSLLCNEFVRETHSTRLLLFLFCMYYIFLSKVRVEICKCELTEKKNSTFVESKRLSSSVDQLMNEEQSFSRVTPDSHSLGSTTATLKSSFTLYGAS